MEVLGQCVTICLQSNKVAGFAYSVIETEPEGACDL